ncbi:hypothetical protein [Streptomyces sp. OR43]|uniref:hypothetical protein n=1 Tax=Streptomyces sp. or43 TaxID=2478957 RepID=UPI0016510FC7|nr:hypothetical protein [Streptomyces sp. or43]
MKRVTVPVGLVTAGLVVAIGCRVAGWLPGVVLGAAVVLVGLVLEWSERGKRTR